MTIWLNPRTAPCSSAILTGLVTPVWCTSWRKDATTMIGPLLGLPDLPTSTCLARRSPPATPTATCGNATTSMPGSAMHPPSGSTTTSPASTTNGRRSVPPAAPTALVQPDPHVGLLPEHLVEVLAGGALLAVARADAPGVPREAEAV